jgi:hypothetical protein
MDFEQLYKDELRNRERVLGNVAVPIGLLTVLGGLIGTMVRSYTTSSDTLGYLFGWLSFVAASLFVVAAYSLFRSIHGHVYKIIPPAAELKDYELKLIEWHIKYGDGVEHGEADFQHQLEEMYIEAADINRNVNIRKSEYLFRANGAIAYCAFLAAAAFVPFLIAERSRPPVEYRVAVTQLPSANLVQGDTSYVRRQEACGPTTAAAKASAAPAQRTARGSDSKTHNPKAARQVTQPKP